MRSLAYIWHKPLYLILSMSVLVLAGITFGIFVSEDRPTKEAYRVGVLMSGESRRERLTGFQHGLVELGFHEGKNVMYQIATATESRHNLASRAYELFLSQPDVIIALGGLEADAAQQAQERYRKETGRSVPVVFAGVASAAARGLLQNPQQAQQITGVENLDAELSGKRLEYFKRLLPKLKRVGVVYQPGIIPSEQGVVFAQEAALHLGLEIITYPIRSGDDILALESTIFPGACDGLLLMPSFVIESEVETFYRLAVEKRMPVMGLRVKDASQYYFASFGPNVYYQGRQAARQVAKIFNHSPLEDIPVETPDRIELVINITIAGKMGLTLTPAQLHYADELIGRDGNG